MGARFERGQRHQKRRSQRTPRAHLRRRRSPQRQRHVEFNAPEVWHEPQSDESDVTLIEQNPGAGYRHVVTVEEVRERVDQLPASLTAELEVVQLSRMTRKRALFPCYGMQWGTTVYLYPIEESLVELYGRPPLPAQRIDAEMFGGRWVKDGQLWRLEWTESSVRDFYLNNVLIHEIGHIGDHRNTSFCDRERYANWFAIEYGYRASRGRR